ncbi:MAG: hypothetical protein NZV14_05900 [Bryobacteraceae bacterium]|nr:hypothetical protein [Bryobacteraceae bacterium]MDW8377673.1 hypothetical protein [Bryobacterales bacterium]
MGFALWIEGDVCRACGTHEYRPMGVAVISSSDYFRARDFRPSVRRPDSRADSFAGYFASLAEMNAYLETRRRAQATRRDRPGRKRKFRPRICQLL